MKILSKTIAGLEQILADEIEQLGGKNIRILKRAVSFEGDLKILYRSNLELRTALRILVPIYSFKARNENVYYDKIKQLDWSKYMRVTDTLAINGTTHSQYFNHSKYVALKAKDAIVDQFREKEGRRPNVNVHAPTLRLNIHIQDEDVNVSLDSSGQPLFKRGYRIERMEAPLNEILAAGMILSSGWKKDCDFVDAMCGSGTLLIEAGMMAKNIPPLWFRKEGFGFQRWRDYDEKLWQTVLSEAKERITDFNHKIYGFDRDFKAISTAKINVLAAELTENISLRRMAFERLEAPAEKGILIINPPYDERLHIKNINELYKMMGDQFKQNFKGWEAWIISSNMQALKHIGLRPSKKIRLMNGALDCKFLKFEMYEGSRKAKKIGNDV